jgi:hypothetical protein
LHGRYNRKKPKSLEFIEDGNGSFSKEEIAVLRSALQALESGEGAAVANAGQITELRGLLTKLT